MQIVISRLDAHMCIYNRYKILFTIHRFLAEESRLDVLINNAGVMAVPHTGTKDRFEMHIGTNHMGHFLLTHLLLDRLKRCAPSRIINVSSFVHVVGRIYRDDLNGGKSYNRILAYCNSKLANILFTRELSKRLHGTGVTAKSLNPGVVNTEIIRYNRFIGVLIFFPMQILGKTAKSGAQTTLMLALDPRMRKISGNYYADCALSNEAAVARDDETADWLWKTSERWTGIKSVPTMHLEPM